MFVCQSALLKWELFSDRVKIVNYDLQLLMLVIWIFPLSLSLFIFTKTISILEKDYPMSSFAEFGDGRIYDRIAN